MRDNAAEGAESIAMLEQLAHAAEQYLRTIGMEHMRRTAAGQEENEQLRLEDVTAFIQVSGGIQGGILLSVDHALSRQLAKQFMVEEINDVEAGQYAVEVIAEIANIVSAHALNDCEETDLALGHPLMILSRDMGIRAASFQQQAFETPGGRFRLVYIPKMDKTELASIVTVQN